MAVAAVESLVGENKSQRKKNNKKTERLKIEQGKKGREKRWGGRGEGRGEGEGRERGGETGGRGEGRGERGGEGEGRGGRGEGREEGRGEREVRICVDVDV